MVEALLLALREIANRAGAPTMHYSPENERKEQRESLDWIAAAAAKAIAANTQPETMSEWSIQRDKVCLPIIRSKKKLSEKVKLMCAKGYIIEAIKYVRTTNTSAGASLLTAKRYVDDIRLG